MVTLKNKKDKPRKIKSIKNTQQKIKLGVSKLSQKKLRRKSKKQHGGIFILNGSITKNLPEDKNYVA